MTQEYLSGGRLEEVVSFVAVADHGSFTHAARSLGRDPTVVSRRVTALEQRLGVRLMQRSTRRLALTEAGSRFLEAARAALGDLAAAETEAQTAGEARGLFRLAVPAAFGRMWIAPYLPDFLAAHPRVSIEASFSDRFVDLIAERFDLAIRVGSLRDSALVGRKIAVRRRMLCASPDYLQQRGTPAEPGDLLGHACLRFTGVSTYPDWVFQRDGRSRAVRVSGPLTTDDAEALVQAACAGAGLLLCADWLVGREVADGRLVPVMTDWTQADDGAVYALTAPGPPLAGKTRAFLDWVTNRFRPSAPWRI